ncbi:MAG: hypothetical protein JO257_06620 [Deltaproteobacteria bacterium]|nr:hypothetical protein [Deltaproteobacteria bacterium]
MLWYRSIVVGLLGACCLLLAQRPRVELRAPLVIKPGISTWDGTLPPTIVDVSPLVAQDQLGALVRLQPGEHVVAMESPQRYVDVTIAGPFGQRRVLLLQH